MQVIRRSGGLASTTQLGSPYTSVDQKRGILKAWQACQRAPSGDEGGSSSSDIDRATRPLGIEINRGQIMPFDRLIDQNPA